MTHTITISAGEELQDLISEMDSKYLDKIDALCNKISNVFPETATEFYGNYSRSLIDLAEQHVRYSRISWVPYLLELLEKEEVGHDCRSCSSSCTIRHTAQIEGIVASHDKIKASLGLHRAITLLYSQDADELKELIQVMVDTLSAMITTEEERMIPLIRQVQGAIHAHE